MTFTQNMSDHSYQNPLRPQQSLAGFLIIGLMGMLCLFVAYSAYWFYYAGVVKEHIDNHVLELSENDVVLSETPSVRGFPFFHTVHYTGHITTSSIDFNIPSVLIKGISLPGQVLSISFPNGLSWKAASQIGPSYLLNGLNLKLTLPDVIPDKATVEELTQWQALGQYLKVHELSIQKDPLNLMAAGEFSLDQYLQPKGQLVIESRGHEKLIQSLSREGFLSAQDNLFIQGAISGFSKIDAKTSEKILHMSFELKDGFLYVGPIKIAPIPPIMWPSDQPVNLNKNLQVK